MDNRKPTLRERSTIEFLSRHWAEQVPGDAVQQYILNSSGATSLAEVTWRQWLKVITDLRYAECYGCLKSVICGRLKPGFTSVTGEQWDSTAPSPDPVERVFQNMATELNDRLQQTMSRLTNPTEAKKAAPLEAKEAAPLSDLDQLRLHAWGVCWDSPEPTEKSS